MKNWDVRKFTEKLQIIVFTRGIIPEHIPTVKINGLRKEGPSCVGKPNFANKFVWQRCIQSYVPHCSIGKAPKSCFDAVLVLATIGLVCSPYCVGEVHLLVPVRIVMSILPLCHLFSISIHPWTFIFCVTKTAPPLARLIYAPEYNLLYCNPPLSSKSLTPNIGFLRTIILICSYYCWLWQIPRRAGYLKSSVPLKICHHFHVHFQLCDFIVAHCHFLKTKR